MPCASLSQQTRRRIAIRLLPFVSLIWLINWIDRVNVAFANLRMSTELGFSDTVYGFGVGLFAITYMMFEIPGAVLVERWSARKWIARIMISWGLVTILTGFIHNATQFYAARLALGASEASLFPGLITYLTHWFRAQDRARAISSLYAGIPFGALIGSPLAGLLLRVHWLGLPGWRWLFIIEGIPAILFGIVTLFYLTDRPAQAKWLNEEQKRWIIAELEEEKTAKKRVRSFTVLQAFSDKRVLLLMLAWAIGNAGGQSNNYWLPTFLKRLSGLPNERIALFVMLPYLLGLIGLVVNSWHSDRTGERRWHAAVPVAICGLSYMAVAPVQQAFPLAMAAFACYGLFVNAGCPAIWSLPSMILSETSAAATFGLINSVGQFGGFIGPYTVGYLSDHTHSLTAGFVCIGGAFIICACILASLRIKAPKVAPIAVGAEAVRG